jgi:hypothetical protein
LQFSPPFLNKNFFISLKKFANFIAKDGLPKQPPAGASASAKAEYQSLAARVNDRYGTFLGPLGIMALGITPMSGEADMYGSKVGCPALDDEDPYVPPEPCPDMTEE